MVSIKKREHLYQIPIKKIESVMKLGAKYNISSVEIGDVKIAFKSVQTSQPIIDAPLKILKEAAEKKGRPLTAQEQREEILFGPGGSIKEENEF